MRKKIELKVVAECCYDPEREVSTICTSMPDFKMEVKKGEKVLGSVGGCIGADVELKDSSIPGTTGIYYIHPVELWNAFQKSMKAKGYIEKALILPRDIFNKGVKDEPKN